MEMSRDEFFSYMQVAIAEGCMYEGTYWKESTGKRGRIGTAIKMVGVG